MSILCSIDTYLSHCLKYPQKVAFVYKTSNYVCSNFAGRKLSYRVGQDRRGQYRAGYDKVVRVGYLWVIKDYIITSKKGMHMSKCLCVNTVWKTF